MDTTRIEAARPAPEAPLDAPGVDRAFIDRLVRTFYARVLQNDRLAPIFNREISGDWEPHLEKMTDFWCAVILKTGGYNGRPVPAHMKIADITQDDFAIWLGIFRETANDLCTPDVAAVFVERAERIAKSLQLALFYHLPALREGRVAPPARRAAPSA